MFKRDFECIYLLILRRVHIDCETVQSVIVIIERKKTYVHIGCLNEGERDEKVQ